MRLNLSPATLFSGFGLISVILGLLMLAPDNVLAQTSRDYARMGKRLWVAFECAAFADVAGNAKDSERLFIIGYEQGKTFIEALQVGKISRQDANEMVPIAVSSLLSGPSPDFILGRVWEAAVDDAIKELTKVNHGDQRQVIASKAFSRMNCSLM